MKNVQSVEFYTGSREEALPDFADDFPYIASRAELDKYIIGQEQAKRMVAVAVRNRWRRQQLPPELGGREGGGVHHILRPDPDRL